MAHKTYPVSRDKRKTGLYSKLRSEAKASGRGTFFTGKPCAQGHVSSRYTGSGSCVECTSSYNKARYNGPVKKWRQDNKQRIKNVQRASYMVRKYGLTKEQYLDILHMQKGVCAICESLPEDVTHGTLCVDHNHETGAVRGLLCHSCNSAIGQLKESKKILESAINYLERGN